MRYIEAFSEEYENWYYKRSNNEIAVFLAGGISNCHDWQSEMVDFVRSYRDVYSQMFKNIVLINPRRNSFNVQDPSESEKQIVWEHAHLKSADVILFWFCQETLCPITLFEYGKWLVSNKKLIVGSHHEYKRKSDVIIQTRLERPRQLIVHSLEELKSELVGLFN